MIHCACLCLNQSPSCGYASNYIGYSRMVQSELEGGTQIKRPDALGNNSRRLEALNGKRNWYQTQNPQNKTGPTNRDKIQQWPKSKSTQVSSQNAPETILFIPHTPNPRN